MPNGVPLLERVERKASIDMRTSILGERLS
jgi:hypothetical protein